MAIFYGVELKRVKTFHGYEGDISQGDVYVGGKKVGFWTEDMYGGPSNIEFLSKEDKEKFNACFEKWKRDDSYSVGILGKDYEMFMNELCELKIAENEWKKCIKKGYREVVKAWNVFENECTIFKPMKIYWAINSEELVKKLKEDGYNRVKVFSCANDFIM